MKNSYHSYLFTNAVSSNVFFLHGVASLVVGLLGLWELLRLLRGNTLCLAFSVSTSKLKIDYMNIISRFLLQALVAGIFSLEFQSGLGFVSVLQF